MRKFKSHFFGYSGVKYLHCTNFNSPFRPSLFIFFFIKRLRYQKDDSLVSYSAQFLSENPRVVEIIFYVNFLSSRKYDWNVAPKDLEKYGAPTAHASYFFFKENKSLFTSTTTIKNKRIKKYFSTCLLFHFLSCSYYTIKQSTLLFSSIMFYLSKNILSLLAGKSEQICTAFPLTTFSTQKCARPAFKKFSAKTSIQLLVQKFSTLTSQKFLNKRFAQV